MPWTVRLKAAVWRSSFVLGSKTKSPFYRGFVLPIKVGWNPIGGTVLPFSWFSLQFYEPTATSTATLTRRCGVFSEAYPDGVQLSLHAPIDRDNKEQSLFIPIDYHGSRRMNGFVLSSIMEKGESMASSLPAQTEQQKKCENRLCFCLLVGDFCLFQSQYYCIWWVGLLVSTDEWESLPLNKFH